MADAPTPYRLSVARTAKRALTDALPEKVAAAAYAFVTGPLVDNPRRMGTPLEPPLVPTYSARRGDYRVLYLIDDGTHTVRVTAVRHRSDACRH